MSLSWKDFQGVNAAAALELYDEFRADPSSVDEATRAFFERVRRRRMLRRSSTRARRQPVLRARPARRRISWSAPSTSRSRFAATDTSPPRSIRFGSRPVGDPALRPETHGVTEDDLRSLPASLLDGPVAEGAATMWDVVERLRAIYCSTTGYDIAHIFVPEERKWLREAIETGRYRAPNDPIDPIALLDRLTDVEAFEKFLHRTFPGKTRFSIEGLDMLVPILDEVIAEAAEAGMRQAFIGMAHRGRLNVMAHVLGKPYDQILAEFKDPVRERARHRGHAVERRRQVSPWGVARGRRRRAGRSGGVDAAESEPSRSDQSGARRHGARGGHRRDASRGPPTFNPDAVLPILIHGDAAFPGQGVVAETLNLHRLDGYTTGGTIHIIANNQIGFTTDPSDSASTLYASGLARGFKIPIVHVNADDPEACVAAARLAFAYRMKFRRDVLIDLVGYRRYGHNEGDEPAFTQPVLYRKISRAPDGARALGEDARDARPASKAGRPQALLNLRARRAAARRTTRSIPRRVWSKPPPEIAAPGTAAQTKTAVPLDRLRALNDSLLDDAGGLHGPSQARARPRAAAAGVRVGDRTHDRLGRRRGAGARVAFSRTARRSG